MSFFPVAKSSNTTTSSRFLFEKSATYFDGELVPRRVHALLPKAKLVSRPTPMAVMRLNGQHWQLISAPRQVTIIISPAKRAYSWYQHQRSHGDPVALNYTFNQVLTAGEGQPKALRDLRVRCLSPGMYSHHLDRWLLYFPPQQISIIDGEQLRLDPVTAMTKLQHFLKIRPVFDYSLHLRSASVLFFDISSPAKNNGNLVDVAGTTPRRASSARWSTTTAPSVLARARAATTLPWMHLLPNTSR